MLCLQRTSSRPVMEYACPFTRPLLSFASDSAELVICKKTHLMRFNRMSEAIPLITAGLRLYWYYINGTSHHGASVQGLLHDGEQVVWRFLGFIQFPDTAGKILHGLERAATFQGLVAAV